MLGCTCLISNVVSDELGFMRAQSSPGELTRQGCAAALTVNRSMQKLCVEGGDGELNKYIGSPLKFFSNSKKNILLLKLLFE